MEDNEYAKAELLMLIGLLLFACGTGTLFGWLFSQFEFVSLILFGISSFLGAFLLGIAAIKAAKWER